MHSNQDVVNFLEDVNKMKEDQYKEIIQPKEYKKIESSNSTSLVNNIIEKSSKGEIRDDHKATNNNQTNSSINIGLVITIVLIILALASPLIIFTSCAKTASNEIDNYEESKRISRKEYEEYRKTAAVDPGPDEWNCPRG